MITFVIIEGNEGDTEVREVMYWYVPDCCGPDPELRRSISRAAKRRQQASGLGVWIVQVGRDVTVWRVVGDRLRIPLGLPPAVRQLVATIAEEARSDAEDPAAVAAAVMAEELIVAGRWIGDPTELFMAAAELEGRALAAAGMAIGDPGAGRVLTRAWELLEGRIHVS